MMRIFLLTTILLTWVNAFSHPGWGIVFDSKGNLFFTDIVNTSIWKYDTNGNLSVFSKDKWSHQLFIDADDNLFICNEEFKMGNGWNSVIKTNPMGEEDYIIQPTKYGESFSGSVIAIDAEENIYYEYKNKIYKRVDGNNFKILFDENNFESIRNLSVDKHGSLFVVDASKIKKIINDSEIITIAENLLDEKPIHGAYGGRYNHIYGITFDTDENIYVAYYGNSKVLKILPDGSHEDFYLSEGDWYPTGVEYNNGSLYIFEEGHAPEDGPTALRVLKIYQDGSIETLLALGQIGGKPVSTK